LGLAGFVLWAFADFSLQEFFDRFQIFVADANDPHTFVGQLILELG
jgi:hypothetical protein